MPELRMGFAIYSLVFKALVFALILLTQSLAAFGSEPAILARIQTFKGQDGWGSMSTNYTPRADGRYQYSDVKTNSTAGNCGDFLAQFQKRTLDQMAKEGYISKRDRNNLMELQKLGIAPHQLVLVTLYSKMSRKEAEKHFGGQIPEERILDQSQNEVEIFRGTLYAVRGYDITKAIASSL